MFVRCKEILSLPSFKTSTVVAGASGLNRIISWLYIAECLDNPLKSVDWINGGELVYITGVGLQSDKNQLIDFIYKLNEKNASGLLINIGEFFSEIPEEALKVANELSLPLIEIPWNVKLLDISQDVSSAIIMKKLEMNTVDNLLEVILFGDLDTAVALIAKAKHYEYENTDKHRIVIVNFDNISAYIENKYANTDIDSAPIMKELQNLVNDAFSKSDSKVITMQKNNSIICMLKSNNLDTKLITTIISNMKKTILNRFSSLTFNTGVGNSYNAIKDMQKSYNEAEKALKIACCENKTYSTFFYENPNIYFILLNIADKSLFYTFINNIIAPLLQHDKMNDTDLFYTLENYLKENCNIISTANKLFVHKNTLKYRIQKIERILNCDLSDLNVYTELNLAMKMYKLLQVKI